MQEFAYLAALPMMAFSCVADDGLQLLSNASRCRISADCRPEPCEGLPAIFEQSMPVILDGSSRSAGLIDHPVSPEARCLHRNHTSVWFDGAPIVCYVQGKDRQ